MGFSDGSVRKASASNAEDLGLIPGLGKSPGEENANPLQYSCLENSMDRGAYGTTVHGGHKGSRTTEQLTFDFHFICDGKGDPKSLEYLYIFPGFIYVLHGNKTGSRPLFSIKYFQLWK